MAIRMPFKRRHTGKGQINVAIHNRNLAYISFIVLYNVTSRPNWQEKLKPKGKPKMSKCKECPYFHNGICVRTDNGCIEDEIAEDRRIDSEAEYIRQLNAEADAEDEWLKQKGKLIW